MWISRHLYFCSLLCLLLVTDASRLTAKREYSGTELARQNRITQQILTQFLQRRLFPHLSSPVNSREQPQPKQQPEHDEALDSDESELVTSHVSYDDEEDESNDCANCVEDSVSSAALNRWTMPLLKLGEKRYYLGIFFKANWYRASKYCRYHGMELASIANEEENKLLEETLAAEGLQCVRNVMRDVANWYKSAQYCRYHGMHLASISSQQENDQLEKHIRDSGFGHEHFWTSGTDQGEEGHFFWMSTGRPLTFTNWNAGEPNNFRYENGEEEHCLELWNRDGKGLKWNDTPCSFETYFVCEVQ